MGIDRKVEIPHLKGQSCHCTAALRMYLQYTANAQELPLDSVILKYIYECLTFSVVTVTGSWSIYKEAII